MSHREGDQISHLDFKITVAYFAILDFFHPTVAKRCRAFGIGEEMTVVDYGCGLGRYTTRFAAMVGPKGKVYAVDIQPLAVEEVKRRAAKQDFLNVQAMLAQGYDSGLPGGVADVICAIDMFSKVQDPTRFLTELRRITRDNGTLVIDDGHQPRSATKEKIQASGQWVIREETRDHLKCSPA